MGHYDLQSLQLALSHYGYWFLLAILLLENAGLPLPGETILLLAGYLAAAHRGLYLPYVIGVGTISAVLGDNVGYLIGARGGRPLLDRYGKLIHITKETISVAEARVGQHGAAVVFGARFVAGIRIIAGPMAGALHMPWRSFVLFNSLGAVAWVAVVSSIGYFFGSRLHLLEQHIKQAQEIVVLVSLGTLVFFFVRWRFKKGSEPAG